MSFDTHSLSAGPDLLHGVRNVPGDRQLDRLSNSTEEALVGGMVSLISRRIVAGKAPELEALLPDLVEFTLTPYVGTHEAAEVSRIPSPQ